MNNTTNRSHCSGPTLAEMTAEAHQNGRHATNVEGWSIVCSECDSIARSRLRDPYPFYAAYSQACYDEACDPLSFDLWTVHGRPEAPIY